MYNPLDIIDIIACNVRRTRNPFGIPRSLLNRWYRRLDIPRMGDAMLFTGLMYQFAPYIERSTQYLAKFEDTPWARYIRLAGFAPPYLAGLGLSVMTPGSEKKKFDAILQNIAGVLTASRVDFFYRPELDHYSGILLYDLGDQDGFTKHARYVAGKLKAAGIKRLVTVDPHTTYALKVLFPRYADAHFDIKTYFELVDFQPGKGHRRITLHDPCFYGRYLELSDAPRSVLAGLGVECVLPENAGLFTGCCGGPAESISPKLSAEVGRRGLEELNATGEKIVAMCPVCLVNLTKAGAEVEDLSTVIAGQL